MDPARYVKTWTRPGDDSVLQKGDVFEFNLLPDTAVENCMARLVYEPVPPISNTVKVIQTVK